MITGRDLSQERKLELIKKACGAREYVDPTGIDRARYEALGLKMRTPYGEVNASVVSIDKAFDDIYPQAGNLRLVLPGDEVSDEEASALAEAAKGVVPVLSIFRDVGKRPDLKISLPDEE